MQLNIKILGWILGLIGMHGILRAQEITVVNAADGSTIPNVLIFNQDETVSTVTDQQGKVDLTAFATSDTLCFQHRSYNFDCQPKIRLTEKMGGRMALVESVYLIDEFEVVTERNVVHAEDNPMQMQSIGTSEIALNNPLTTADMLQMGGQVSVQRSQLGGGSPVLRGFEANKILLVIDGVRMNNAIYRGGHLQNAITVDANVLDHTDVIFGPGSVIYGSDALGGVIHFHTRNPKLAANDSNRISGNVMTRYTSASASKTAHADFNVGFRKLGFLTSVTATDHGDLTMGRVRAHGYDSLGLVLDYAERIGDADVMQHNTTPHLQRRTGFQQLDFLQKVLYQPQPKTDVLFNAQYSTSSDVPRFDRYNDYTDGQLKWAEWYYGPQNRLLTSLTVNTRTKTKWYDVARVIGAFQRIDEDRIKRRFGRDGRITNEEDVQVYSLNADFTKSPDSTSRLYFGMEITHNHVVSTAFEENIANQEITAAATRYPDGGSSLSTAASYANFKKEWSSKLRLNAGARYALTRLTANFVDTRFVQLPFDGIDLENHAVTGSTGLIWDPSPTWKISTMLATGFRSPNIDDFGKVFEKDGLVTVPNDALKPEYAYNADLSLSKSFHAPHTKQPLIQLSLIGWYTYLRDAIVRREHQLNGQDSLLYEGSMARIVTNTNAAEAHVYGATFKAEGFYGKHWRYDFATTYTTGYDLAEGAPLGHIPPLFGQAAVAFYTDKANIRFFSLWNGRKNIEDFAPSGVDNEVETTADGTPSWYTLNLQTSWNLTPFLTLQATVENILDHHYKPFASGISAPGRNFVMALRAAF